jgi:hypothetical protein
VVRVGDYWPVRRRWGTVGIRYMLDCYRFCYSFSGQKRAFWGKEAGTDAR